MVIRGEADDEILGIFLEDYLKIHNFHGALLGISTISYRLMRRRGTMRDPIG
jgi:hypothetical protein